MRNGDNILSLLTLKPDFVGFIFYDKSSRFVSDFPQINFPETTKKTGVFVNEPISGILNKVSRFRLDFVQLHGNESPEYCKTLQKNQIKIIKVFSVEDGFDFSNTINYEPFCEYFLFDTKGKNYGGNGIKFNWELLQNYKGNKPFFISGGIGKDDVNDINKMSHPLLFGVDINSGFEVEPGLKNIKEIKEFKQQLI